MNRFLLLAACFAVSAAALAEDAMTTPAEAFNAGKAFADSGKAAAGGAVNTTTGSETLPHYSTTAPETRHYGGGRSLIGGAGTTKMTECQSYQAPSAFEQQECEAVNFLARNPAERPRYTIDPETDPLLVGSQGIINNPGSIPGAPTQQCRVETVVTPGTYTTEYCTESYTLENASCRRVRIVSCEAPAYGCAPSGIKTETVSVSGFGRFLVHPTADDFWFVSAGTIAPDGSYINNSHFSGSFYDVYQSDIYFDITNKSDIATFFLNEILYDDNIAVWLNGHLIYHSTGGTDLSTCTYSIELQGIKVTRKGVNDGVHACTIDYFEGGENISNYGGVELKNRLIEGRNHIRIKVAVGKNGDAIIRFKTKAYCPPKCTDQWDNSQCAPLEARTK